MSPMLARLYFLNVLRASQDFSNVQQRLCCGKFVVVKRILLDVMG